MPRLSGRGRAAVILPPANSNWQMGILAPAVIRDRHVRARSGSGHYLTVTPDAELLKALLDRALQPIAVDGLRRTITFLGVTESVRGAPVL